MRAPLAEQEQEDEEEQDDEVLSSIEEQLEFGDDDMNDLNGTYCAYFPRPVHPSGVYLSGRLKICFCCFLFYSYVSLSPLYRTAQSALHVMLLSYYIGMCVFHERQRDICRRRTYSQGFAKVVRTCPTTGKTFPHCYGSHCGFHCQF